MARTALVLTTALLLGATGAGTLSASASTGTGAATPPAPFVDCTFSGALARQHAGPSAQVPLGFTITFYGTPYSSTYVNNDGAISFVRAAPQFQKFSAATNLPPMIAPFFSDVDTTNSSSGVVHYGHTTVAGHKAFCVDWGDPSGNGVGYYNGRADKHNKFQLVLIDRSDLQAGAFDAVFNYAQLEWDTGTSSTTAAGAGFDAGNGVPSDFYGLIGSGFHNCFLDAQPEHSCVDGIGSPGPFVRRHSLQQTHFSTPNAQFPSPTDGRFDFAFRGGSGRFAPPNPTVSLGGESFFEGDANTVEHDMTVTLDNPSPAPVTIYYKISHESGDTATAGSDFVAASGRADLTQQFAGITATMSLIPIDVMGDTVREPNEQFTVTITKVVGGTIDSAHAVSHPLIVDDDDLTPGMRIAVDSPAMFEGDTVATKLGTNKLSFTVSLSRPVPAGHTVTVQCKLQQDTATQGFQNPPPPGTDYINISVCTKDKGSITFMSGEWQKTMQLAAIEADTTPESNERFNLVLSDPTNGATIAPGLGVGRILNDD